MTRISRLVAVVGLGVLSSFAVRSEDSTRKVLEATSTGLITFADKDAAIRVAVTFGEKDDAVVATVVRFLDSRGNVLKQQRGDLRNGEPIVADLTRRDLTVTGSLLVRVEVVHELTARDARYPILVTVQPIATEGFGRFPIAWRAGVCLCPECGSAGGSPQHVDCDPSESP
jgi:hypothetical protein